MLKSTDHDSMSGEHVGTTSRLIITSEKLGIWPLAAPTNQGFGKLGKFPRGKKTKAKMALDIEHMGGGRTLPSMLRKGRISFCYEN